MERSLLRWLISSRSINNHDIQSHFLFLYGRFLKNLLLWNRLAKWTETWKETHTENPLWRMLICIRIPNFIPIGKLTWSTWEILVYDWLKLKNYILLWNHEAQRILSEIAYRASFNCFLWIGNTTSGLCLL